ncbi:MLO-like protein 6 [Apostasia shenzhenica]|uniref:MLO-like protein 6 n=1 Tax=Apostasia shenzhenica TaxID=1088818 RepID=A0A2I0AU83_9ASPA|nr:MLO-like protein 6 [Apostasia shenzhenica]
MLAVSLVASSLLTLRLGEIKVCFVRLFTGSILRADYYALRTGFIAVIITKMCLQGSRNAVIVSGDVFVNLNDELFWFGRPRWLLISWLASIGSKMGSSMRETIFADRMMEGLKNWHSMAKKSLESNGIASSSSQSISRSPSPVMRPIPIPRAGSSWLTLPSPTSSESDSAASLSPLWSPLPLLQSGRASSSKGKELPLSVARSAGSLWMTPQPLPRSSESPAANSSSSSRSPLHSFRRAGGRFSKGKELSLTMPSAESFSSAFRAVSAGEFGLRRSSGLSRLPGSSPSFEFPTGMRELMEIQRVTEEMIGPSSRSSFEGGELSFRAWWKQEIIFPSGWRSPSSSRD